MLCRPPYQDYAQWLQAAEIHWFFVQSEQAMEYGLYVPAAMGFLTGIEASIRVTMHQLARRGLDDEIRYYLSNLLLKRAKDEGLPVKLLAFPNETDFESKLEAKKPYTEIVRVRHNLAHGEIREYLIREFNAFTPECLRDLTQTLRDISRQWVSSLAEYRADNLDD